MEITGDSCFMHRLAASALGDLVELEVFVGRPAVTGQLSWS